MKKTHINLLSICTSCILLAASALGFENKALESSTLEVGNKAPDFGALDDNGQEWKSSDHIGKSFLVVYFYPAAMTGGCTKQACSYRDDKQALSKLDAVVVGVSGDNVNGLKIFKKVHNLNFALLSDTDGEIAKKFGVPVKEGATIKREVDGQEVTLTRGVTAARWTFVIDKEGKIVYRNAQVNAADDSKEVLAVIQKIGDK